MRTFEFDIPAQDLNTALQAFAAQAPAHLRLVYDERSLAGKRASALQGAHNPRVALMRLLEGSGLAIVSARQGVITIGDPATAGEALPAADPGAPDGHSRASGMAPMASGPAEEEGSALPPVRVTARPLSELTENSDSYTPARVGVGAKTAQSLREIPRSISVLTRQQLEDQGIHSLNEALEQLPGVTIEPNGQWSAESWYSRGFEITNILVDGSMVREKDSMDSSVNAALAMYDSVQLLRGPDSLFSGNGEPSGSINLVRKRPLHAFQAKATLAAGSWDNYRGEFDISSPLAASGNVRGRVVASYNDTQKFWDNADRNNHMVYGVLDIDLTHDTTLTLGASRDRKSGSGRDSAPPGLPRYSNGDPLPLSRSQGSPAYDYRNSEAENYFARLEHAFSAQWKLKAGVSRTESSSDIRFAHYNGAVTPGTTTGTQMMVRAGNSTSRSDGVDVNVGGSFGWLGREHSLVFGADYLHTENDNNRGPQMFANGAGFVPIDWATFDPDHPPVLGPWRAQNIQRYETDRKGVYGYGKFQIHGPLKFVLGGRYSSYESRNYGGVSEILNQKQDGDDTFTPYYALVYDFDRQWTAYLTMAKSIEDQSHYYTASYQPLSEVSGTSWELGMKGELLEGMLNTNLTLYQARRKHLAVKLFDDPNFDDDGLDCCYAGDGKFLSRGVEIDVSGELTPNLQINAGYTYDDNKTDYGANDGNRYASYTPKHTLRLWAVYRLDGVASGWRIGGGVKAQSEVFRSGTVRTWNAARGDFSGPAVAYDFVSPGRAVYNAFAQYRINPGWSLALNVNNVFDKYYLRSVNSTAGNNIYGEPRSFMLTLRGTL